MWIQIIVRFCNIFVSFIIKILDFMFQIDCSLLFIYNVKKIEVEKLLINLI